MLHTRWRSDIAYYRQLDRIDVMAHNGRDTAMAKQVGIMLKESLDRSSAWLNFLRNLQQ